MGRTVIAEESIQEAVDKFFGTAEWQIGLLIGQQTSQRDYVIHLAKTPDPVEDEVSSEQDKVPKNKSSAKPSRLDLVTDAWIVTHAKQVNRMLPGGLDVIGIFAVAPPNMMQNSQTKLRQILFAIQKKMATSQQLSLTDDMMVDRILLQVCMATRKIVCRTYDVTDIKSSAHPAEWRYQSILDRWLHLETTLAVDIPINVTKESKNSKRTLIEHIQAGIKPFCTNISNGQGIFGNCFREPNSLLDQSGEYKRAKGYQRNSCLQSYQVSLLLPYKNEISSLKVSDCISSLWVRGIIKGSAYVYGKATVKEGIQALKSDVIRSLVSRCELLCDDINVIEEDTTTKEVYNTPIRVFGTLPGTQLKFCDYMFQDEQTDEVAERFEELLDIKVTEDGLCLTSERAPEDDDLKKPEKVQKSKTTNMAARTSKITYFAIHSLIAVITAIGLAYLYQYLK